MDKDNAEAQTYYARPKDGADECEWQSLENHLSGVARRAADFAKEFSSAEWGHVAGLCNGIITRRD